MNSRKPHQHLPSIVFVDQHKQIGGGQVSLSNIINAVITQYKDAKVYLLAPYDSQISKKISKSLNVIYYYEFTSNLKIMQLLFILVNNINIFLALTKIKEAKILYVNGMRTLLSVYGYSMIHNLVLVIHIRLIYNYLVNQVLHVISKSNKKSIVICPSKYCYDKFIQDTNHNSIRLLENALTEKQSKIEYHNLFDREINIGYFGRYSYSKGFDIFCKLSCEYDNKFYSFGSADFENRIDCESINVINGGKVDDIIETIHKYRLGIILVPSRVQESFGRVMIEAMIASAIPITMGSGNLRYLAQNTGAFVVNDYSMLERKLTNLLKYDRNQLARISRGTYAKTKKEYNYNEHKNHVIELFSELKHILNK